MTVKLLCLDADGTVFNTMPSLERLAVRLLRTYGLSTEEARDTYTHTSGLPFRDQLDLIFPGSAKNWRVSYIFEKAKWGVVLREQTVFDDVPQLLTRCRELKIDVAIVSSTRTEVLKKLIDHNGLSPSIAWAGGIEFGPKHKQLITAMNRFRRRNKDVLFVGDSPTDVASAELAVVSFVGLLRDERHRARFQGASLILSLSQLERFL